MTFDVNKLYSAFPNLQYTHFQITSPVNIGYNCIAWAANDKFRWWWPLNGGYWPQKVPGELSVDAFTKAFATIGYEECESPEFELGYEKVAFYSKGDEIQHASRQLINGFWTSKLGKDVDIEHTIHGVEGKIYGCVAKILKRKVT